MSNKPTSASSSELLERLRLGDNAAFKEVYRQHYRSTVAFVKANSGNEDDARDVFQEALLVLVKNLRNGEFRLTVDLGAYLYAVMRNLWLHRLRSRRTRPEVGLTDETPLPDSGVSDMEVLFVEQVFEEKHHTVKELLKTLKTECQKLIEYAYYHQLSAAEIAGLLGYAESFVKVKKHRCMEALREKVQKHPTFNHE